MTTHQTLIVGAGPFGLGLAAYLNRRGHDYCLVGKPLEFWEKHMPAGMLLRSNANWYLDPDHQWTIERFFAEQHPNHRASQPIAREHYIEYMRWMMQQSGIPVLNHYVSHLAHQEPGFRAQLDNGQTIQARNVVLATGFQYFAHSPNYLTDKIPAGRYAHTCDAVRMEVYRNRRVLLIGGRQSAFESAALLREGGAAHVHLSYRHDTPAFAEADWSWVEKIVAHLATHPGWFGELPAAEQADYRYRLWAEGRLKVEPWLKGRVTQPDVILHPRTELVSATLQPDGALRTTLTNGEVLVVDDILLATGYQVDITRLPFLSLSLLQMVRVEQGFPLLDLNFQSSLPGLYFNSLAAGHSFGPFFGFTVGVRTAASLIGRALCETQQTHEPG
ncbi:MAG: putative dimethylaniline monooxygenase [Spirosoma sp.]|nr:putative dimethylaniline monooxygenase [Spirosoma sp.]